MAEISAAPRTPARSPPWPAAKSATCTAPPALPAAPRAPRDDDPVRVAAIPGDVLPDPADRGGHILRARGPGGLWCVPVGHVHPDPAAPDRPGADQVVGRAARTVRV